MTSGGPLLAISLALLAPPPAAPGDEAAPLALVEGQVAPIAFERRVEQVSVSDPAVLAVRSSGGRVEVVGLRGGSARLTVALEGGRSVAFDVRVAAARAQAPAPRVLELRPGEERRLPIPGTSRVMLEDNGVARARGERDAVVVTAVAPGQASLLVVAEGGQQSEWTIRVGK